MSQVTDPQPLSCRTTLAIRVYRDVIACGDDREGDARRSVQVDVKVVTVAGRKAYQYTACDDCTRLRVLRLYPRLNVLTSFGFLAQIVRAFPFPIRKIQTDNVLSARG